MEEDYLGPLKAFVGVEYVLCDRCGKPLVRRRAKVARDGLAEDTLSEFEELCDECRRTELEGPGLSE
jgi:uncharacterized protein with PIN domain